MSTTIQHGAADDTSREAAAAPPIPVIELQALSVRFGKREILSDLTCSLRGRAIGLLGPNGAGKSTLINSLLGFYKPSSGSARVLGFDIRTDMRRIRSQVGYMPENDAFISKMSAVSFVQMMAELCGLPPAAALERAHEALFWVGLAEARYRELGTYSLGMKQLAKLAQAIAHGPRLLILDEPTNGLDPSARQRMIRMIREGFDVVIASRYQPGSRIYGLTLRRRVISRMGSMLMRILFPTPGVSDYTCGYRAYRAEALKQAYAQYGDSLVNQDGFQCMVDILLKLRKLPLIFGEVPLILRYDLKRGPSKMRLVKTSVSTLRLLWTRRLGH